MITTLLSFLRKPSVAWALLGLGFLIRLLALLKAPGLTTPDSAVYLQTGEALWTTGQMSTPVYMPLFPLLYFALGEFGIRLFQVFVSTLSIWISIELAQVFSRDPLARSLAALFFAFNPFLIYYSLLPLTETLFIFLMLLGLLLLLKSRYFSSGLVWVITLLVKPTPELLIPVIFLIMSRGVDRKSWKQVSVVFAQLGLLYVLIMTPWWIHNQNKYGQFVRLNLGFATNFYVGNVSIVGDGLFLGPEGERLSTPSRPEGMDDVGYARLMTDLTRTFILENPTTFLKYLAIKTFRLWKPFPEPNLNGKNPAVFLVSFVVMASLMVGAFLFFWKQRALWKKDLRFALLASIFCYFTLVHVLTLTNIRYRLPLDAVMVSLAAVGWSVILRRKSDEPSIS